MQRPSRAEPKRARGLVPVALLATGGLLAALACENDSDQTGPDDTGPSGGTSAVSGSNAGGHGGGPTGSGGSEATSTSSTVIGTTGIGGTRNTGGSAGAAGFAGAAGALNECFEMLAAGQRCAAGASRAQAETYEKLDGADSLGECLDACEARSDCYAVSNYFMETGLAQCYTLHGSCDAPEQPVWAEEDAGKEYRKQCDGVDCSYQYLGDWMRCESSGDGTSSKTVEGASSLEDCFDACSEDPTCTAVTDYYWTLEVSGCYLFLAECDDTAPLPTGDPGMTFRKMCD